MVAMMMMMMMATVTTRLARVAQQVLKMYQWFRTVSHRRLHSRVPRKQLDIDGLNQRRGGYAAPWLVI